MDDARHIELARKKDELTLVTANTRRLTTPRLMRQPARVVARTLAAPPTPCEPTELLPTPLATQRRRRRARPPPIVSVAALTGSAAVAAVGGEGEGPASVGEAERERGALAWVRERGKTSVAARERESTVRLGFGEPRGQYAEK